MFRNSFLLFAVFLAFLYFISEAYAAPIPAFQRRADDKKDKDPGGDDGSDGQPAPAGGGRIIQVKSEQCGPSGAQEEPTPTTGPMGSIGWLNCGLESGGWHPPKITIDDVIAVDLRTALQSDSSPFKKCNKYLSLFEKHAKKNKLPPILLASFALQESSCNAGTVGGGGEVGLMQITKDKCGGAPGGNCGDPDFNIGAGAKYFRKTLDSNDGNFLLSLGQYNGWHKGLTKKQATAARYSKCCRCQNNLDYLHQFLNGWMQNIDAYSKKMGKYFNLDVCRNH